MSAQRAIWDAADYYLIILSALTFSIKNTTLRVVLLILSDVICLASLSLTLLLERSLAVLDYHLHFRPLIGVIKGSVVEFAVSEPGEDKDVEKVALGLALVKLVGDAKLTASTNGMSWLDLTKTVGKRGE